VRKIAGELPSISSVIGSPVAVRVSSVVTLCGFIHLSSTIVPS
jgi:hypothetical protein